MTRKFKPGDRVRVRQWEDMATIPAFARAMRPLCGKTAVIECVGGNGVAHVIPDDSANDPLWECFTFTPDMFEPVEEVKPMSGLERALGVQEGQEFMIGEDCKTVYRISDGRRC